MKPFLGIDLTTDKNNEQHNGDVFLAATPSDALKQSHQKAATNAEHTVTKAKLPLPLRIIRAVTGYSALLIILGILRADVSFIQGYQNAPWLHWAAGVCAIIWGILKILSIHKEKTVLGEEESTRIVSNLQSISQAIYTELAVPPGAKDVDILSFFYKVKDGKPKVCEKGMQVAPYSNPVFKSYADSENLYLVNLDGKYVFPLSCVKAIRTVKQHIRILSWNKEEGFNKGIYKQYKLTTDNLGSIHCRQYHIVEIQYNADTYGIYIPNYELPRFELLTGHKADPQ